MSFVPGARVGPYEIVSPLGAGGMGEVYRARDSRLDRDVALKILPEIFAADAERLSRFEREAKALAALNHPHIAQIHGVETSGRIRAIVMELVDGETLAEVLGTNGALPVPEALDVARQIVNALEAAHEAGLVHRDLKPGSREGCHRRFGSRAGR
jgi:eukaryotic-like serine/threonine-protein kinase